MRPCYMPKPGAMNTTFRHASALYMYVTSSRIPSSTDEQEMRWAHAKARERSEVYVFREMSEKTLLT